MLFMMNGFQDSLLTDTVIKLTAADQNMVKEGEAHAGRKERTGRSR